LDLLTRKFIGQFKPEMDKLTTDLKELFESGAKLTEDQYDALVERYEIISDKLGPVMHPAIHDFKENTETFFEELKTQVLDTNLPTNPGEYSVEIPVVQTFPTGPFLDKEPSLEKIDNLLNLTKETKTPISNQEASFDQQILMEQIQNKFKNLIGKAHYRHQDEIIARGGTPDPNGLFHQAFIPYTLVNQENLGFIIENTTKLFNELGDNPEFKDFFDNIALKLNKTKEALNYGELVPVFEQIIDGPFPFPNPGFPNPIPGPGLPGLPVHPPSVDGLTPEQVTQLLSMPRTTPEEMSTYVNILKGHADQISTGVIVSTSDRGQIEADIFSPHTLLSHFNGNRNETLTKLIDSGILDINQDGKTDALDYYSLMKGLDRTPTASDFEGIVNSPQVNDETANEYKAMPRATSEDIAAYVEKMHEDYLNLSLYGGVQVNDLGTDEGHYLQNLINGNNRSGNPRAQEAFDAGIYDFNNDGITDEKDVEILNRFTSGNKNFDDLLTPIDQQPKPPITDPKVIAFDRVGGLLANINTVYPERTVNPSNYDIASMKILFESMPDVIHTSLSRGDNLNINSFPGASSISIDFIDEDFLNSMTERLSNLHENLKGDTRFNKFFEFASEQLSNYLQVLMNESSIFSTEDGSAINENINNDSGKRSLIEMKEYVEIFNPVFDIDGDGKTAENDQRLIAAYLDNSNFEYDSELYGTGFRSEAEIRSQLDMLFNTFNLLDINRDGEKDSIDAKILELMQLLNSLN
jgi:hypothetical protein